MTQCLERGTPERDDASKPSREKIVSIAFGEGSEQFSLIKRAWEKSRPKAR
jgi:hypothetical protein